MRILLCLKLLFLISCNCICANNDQWHDYLSYNACFKTAISDNWVYGVCRAGIIKYDIKTKKVTTISKVNGLSGLNISAFCALNDEDFIVGYEDGNINLFSNGKMLEISDIRDKAEITVKKINSFFVSGDNIYICTSFGVVIYNLEKKEFKNSWILGLEVNNIVQNGGNYLIATESGIYQANKDNPLISNVQAWKRISNDSSPYKALGLTSGQVITVKRISTNSFQLLRFQNGDWISIDELLYFKDLQIMQNKLIVSEAKAIKIFNADWSLDYTKNSLTILNMNFATPSFSSAIRTENGNLFVTDLNYGLLKVNEIDEIITPNCPNSNSCFRIKYIGDKLIVTAGGLTESWNNLNFDAQIYFYDNNWSALNYSNSSLLAGEHDIISVTKDYLDESKLYFASWGGGIFVVKNEVVTANYNQYNSLLQNIDWAGTNFVRVGGSVMDKDGNLFINNGEVNHGIVVLTKDSNWIQYDYIGLNAADGDYYGEMCIDKNSGFIWMNIQRSKKDNGVFVFDINKTVKDLSDDRYRGPFNNSQDNDIRKVGEMDLVDQNGEIVTKIANSLVFDNDGYLWVGTDKGILVNYRPVYVFEDEIPRFNHIEIPRNDGTDNVDYLLENEVITCIDVDAANRKWIGTKYSGIYLLSSDGTKMINHFTYENSSLISNYIYSIAINPNNGEVFISTTNGLVSFVGNAIESKVNNEDVFVYPNPVRSNYKSDITISGLTVNSKIKISDVSGNIVFETTSLGGKAIWDGKNAWGKEVKTGVYVIYVSDESGQMTGVTKIMIIR